MFGFSYDLMQIAFPVRAKRDSSGAVTAFSIPFDRFVKDIVFHRISVSGDTINK